MFSVVFRTGYAEISSPRHGLFRKHVKENVFEEKTKERE